MKRIKLFENFDASGIEVDVINDFDEILNIPGQRWFQDDDNGLDMFNKYLRLRGDYYLLTIGDNYYLGQQSEDWLFFDQSDRKKSIEEIADESGVSSYEILSKLG